ncbi:unnamed protein product [Brachionus calyciflorus]|uniref:Uncharacterized protein n=1 Tax=Brachionus calyciflorus TaxID=104777 RepID=A0A814HJV1_9BILA|nr:unnamed protein product [Brachionus calyciflorus]
MPKILRINILVICFFIKCVINQEVQKICNGDQEPYRLSCKTKTGVSVQSVNILFTRKDVYGKECESLVVYNITEPTQPLQSICNRAKDRSFCIIDKGVVDKWFQVYSLSNEIHPIPVRVQIRYSCSESYTNNSDTKKIKIFVNLLSTILFYLICRKIKL